MASSSSKDKSFNRKYVYLFELDSVRKTDEEILVAQRALYDEIVTNGNVVVMTFNQFADSRGFISLLLNDDYYNSIVKLFVNGAIRLSQYGNIRTIAHYILNSIENSDNEFIYSAFPLCYNQKRLTALVHRSLKYCDLTEIHNYRLETTSYEELKDLFIEVEGKETHETKLTEAEMKATLNKLETILAMIMRISSEHDIYLTPREKFTYSDYSFFSILEVVLTFENDENELWAPACTVIKELNNYKKKDNSRSNYFRELKEIVKERPGERDCIKLAEAILALCYNYISEISINNVSKHYDVNELKKDAISRPTFTADFWLRLAQLWNGGKNSDNKFLQEETNEFELFDSSKYKEFPDFEKAVRVSEYLSFKGEVSGPEVHRYEHELRKQRDNVNKSIATKLGKQLLAIFLSLIIIMIMAFAEEATQNIFAGDFSFLSSIGAVVEFSLQVLIFLVLGEIISDLISKKFPNFLSLSDAVSGIIQIVSDTFEVIFKEGKTYINASTINPVDKEPYSKPKPIDSYETPALGRYRKWKANNTQLVKPIASYPLADLSDPEVVRKLMRLEELHNYSFGVAYKSAYSTMIVDPIVDGDTFFPYERSTSTSGVDGVVTVPVYDGKFILIEQERHSIRSKQLAFPRGFAEKGGTAEENVIRELKEEINAVVKPGSKIVKLGAITPDSGSTTAVVGIYLVELESYEPNKEHEGIKDCVLLTKDELKAKIASGAINDSYTICAYTLYENR